MRVAPDRPSPLQELQLRWQEYRQLVMLLLQWVRHHTAVFEERKFPSSFEEIEVGVWVLGGGRGPGYLRGASAWVLTALPTPPPPVPRSCGASS